MARNTDLYHGTTARNFYYSHAMLPNFSQPDDADTRRARLVARYDLMPRRAQDGRRGRAG